MSQTSFNPDPPRSSLANLTVEGRAPDAGGVIVDATRPRQTEASGAPFRELLAGGVAVLMGGAAVATHVMGAPRLAAAISGAGAPATSAISSLDSRSAVVGTGPKAESGAALPTAAGSLGFSGGGAAGLTAAGAGSDASDLAQMQAMQRESQVFNMQLLALQDQVQQDSQRFTTLSNVMRAKHDTAKAAVSNIRS
ncbi:MAG TPA: hypothetical protein VHL80_10420 [Polyangia bacterium]|nr:hypothetical protein [Polyangia bacterium]